MYKILLAILFVTIPTFSYAQEFPRRVNLVFNSTWLRGLTSTEVLQGIRLAKQDFEDACGITLTLQVDNPNPQRPYVLIGQGYEWPAAGWTEGSTKYGRNAVIKLNSWDPRGWDIEKVRKIVRHELGHALLEMPHSNYLSDVMHPYASALWWSPYEVSVLQQAFGEQWVIPSYIYDELSRLSEARILYRQKNLRVDEINKDIKSAIDSRSLHRTRVSRARVLITFYRSPDHYNPRYIRYYQEVIRNSQAMIETYTHRITLLQEEKSVLLTEITALKAEIDKLREYTNLEIDKYN